MNLLLGFAALACIAGVYGAPEVKRQLVPVPRIIGQHPYWHYSVDPYFVEYPVVDGASPSNVLTPSSALDSSSLLGMDEINSLEKRNGAGNNNNGMWFGPRLGRKKRSIDADSRDNTIDTRTFLKILHNFNWAVVPVKERRTSFTPRLGRSSKDSSHHTSQPYSPRLGRSGEVSSVELDTDEENLSRYTRSGSNGGQGESTQTPSSNKDDSGNSGSPYSPRLGRDNFSPRLGRSSSPAEDN